MFLNNWNYYNWKYEVNKGILFIDRIYSLDFTSFSDDNWKTLFTAFEKLPNYLGHGRWFDDDEIFLWASIESNGLNVCGNLPIVKFLLWEIMFHKFIRKLKFK